jgi:hypothetical protein
MTVRAKGNESNTGNRRDRRPQIAGRLIVADNECEYDELSVDSNGIVVSYLGDTGIEGASAVHSHRRGGKSGETKRGNGDET